MDQPIPETIDLEVVDLDSLPPEEAEAAAALIEMREKAKEAEAAAKRALLQRLGQDFFAEFQEARTFRKDVEQRWIKDLRQYKGLYDPETFAKLKEKGRSKLFLRLARAKVKSLNARLGDMLFPAGDKNWNVSPTPMPEIDREVFAAEVQTIVARDGQLDDEAMKTAIQEVVNERGRKMSTEIDDQLEEGNYEAECRKVIASGNLFGTGILKGPLGTPRRVRRWQKAGVTWSGEMVQEMKPHFSFTPVWNYYPDPLASEVGHCRYEFERRPNETASSVAKLKRDPAFMADQIDIALNRFPTGNIKQLEQWEADLRTLSKDQANRPNPINRFEILERWGFVSGKTLAACGVPVEDENIDYEAMTWQIEDVVIRVDINPFDSESRPFKLYYFDKDESSIWGEGIMSIMRDTERGANTSLRAAVDNAAMSAVPNVEVNTTLMENEADTNNFTAGRTWHRTGRGVEAQYQAVRIIEIPNHTAQFLSLLKTFMELGDEVSTVPRYTYGTTDGSNVSKTVGGLSMLMGQANISLKDLAKNWDDGITTPFITDMYDWNMQFSSKEDIKGDYQVIARGSSSLVAKEIRANALQQFAGDLVKLAPNLGKVRDLFAERARNLDLDPDQFLKTQEEMDKEDTEKQMGLAAMETVDKIAKALNMPPAAVVQNIDQMIGQMSAAMQNVQQNGLVIPPAAAQPAPQQPAGIPA